MDPATLYAITIVFKQPAPDIRFNKLGPQWTLSECIRLHEKPLRRAKGVAGFCLLSERTDIPEVIKVAPLPKTKRYLISIDSDTRAVDLTKWKGTLTECQHVIDRYAGQVTAFCVESRKLQTASKPWHG